MKRILTFIGVQINNSNNLILFLLNKLHNELNKANQTNNDNNFQNILPNQYNYNEVFNQFYNTFKNNNMSIISERFYGMYNRMMRCLNCGIITNNVQCYYYLNFSLEDVKIFKN